MIPGGVRTWALEMVKVGKHKGCGGFRKGFGVFGGLWGGGWGRGREGGSVYVFCMHFIA